MALALESLESLEACDEACEFMTVSLETFTELGAVQVYRYMHAYIHTYTSLLIFFPIF